MTTALLSLLSLSPPEALDSDPCATTELAGWVLADDSATLSERAWADRVAYLSDGMACERAVSAELECAQW